MEPLPPGAEDPEPPIPGVDIQSNVPDSQYSSHPYSGATGQQPYYVSREFYGHPNEYAFDAYSLGHQDSAPAGGGADYAQYAQYYQGTEPSEAAALNVTSALESTAVAPAFPVAAEPDVIAPPPPPPPPPPLPQEAPAVVRQEVQPVIAETVAEQCGDSALAELQQRMQEFLKGGNKGGEVEKESGEKGKSTVATVKPLKGAKLLLPSSTKPKQPVSLPPSEKVESKLPGIPVLPRKPKGKPEGLNLFMPEPQNVPEVLEPSQHLLKARKDILDRQNSTASPQLSSQVPSEEKRGEEGMKPASGWHQRSYRKKTGSDPDMECSEENAQIEESKSQSPCLDQTRSQELPKSPLRSGFRSRSRSRSLSRSPSRSRSCTRRKGVQKARDSRDSRSHSRGKDHHRGHKKRVKHSKRKSHRGISGHYSRSRSRSHGRSRAHSRERRYDRRGQRPEEYPRRRLWNNPPEAIISRWSPEPPASPEAIWQSRELEEVNVSPSQEKPRDAGKSNLGSASEEVLVQQCTSDVVGPENTYDDLSKLVEDISQIDRIANLDHSFSFLGDDPGEKKKHQTGSDHPSIPPPHGGDARDNGNEKIVPDEKQASPACRESMQQPVSETNTGDEVIAKRMKKRRKHKRKQKKHKKKRDLDPDTAVEKNEEEIQAAPNGSPVWEVDRQSFRRRQPSYFQHDDRVADNDPWTGQPTKRLRSDHWPNGAEGFDRHEFGKTYMDYEDDRVGSADLDSQTPLPRENNLVEGHERLSKGVKNTSRSREQNSPKRTSRDGRDEKKGMRDMSWSNSRSRSRSRSHSRSKGRSGSMRSKPNGASSRNPKPSDGIVADIARAAEAARLAALQGPSACAPVQLSRHARRIYVGGLPVGVTEVEITQFFNHLMTIVGGCTCPGLPILSCFMNPEKRFAFMEFRSVEETSNAMAFDGVQFKGETLKIRRPHDYNSSAAMLLGPSEPNSNLNLAALGLVNTVVADGPNKLFVGGLPSYLSEEQVRNLLQIFGNLKAFNLIADREAGTSRGYGFCEYEDTKTTDFALEGLSAISVGGKTLTVRRTQQSQNPDDSRDEKAASCGRSIVKLSDLVNIEEVAEKTRHEDIVADIAHEVIKYGRVCEVVVPRPGEDANQKTSGMGHAYLEVDDEATARRIVEALNGRLFMHRQVQAAVFDRNAYAEMKIT